MVDVTWLTKRSVGLVAGVLFACAANAGPFGLEMGASLADLKAKMQIKEREGQPFMFSVDKVPDPHPDFTSYTLVVTPEQGLCKIIATTTAIPSDAFGKSVTAKFESFQASLEKKYGTSKGKFDYVRSGSIWSEPHHWMMGLYKEDRTLATYWLSGDSSLPDNVKAMALQAKASSVDAGYISLGYEFKNVGACLNHLQGQRASL